jgi:Oxysterol-binding protein
LHSPSHQIALQSPKAHSRVLYPQTGSYYLAPLDPDLPPNVLTNKFKAYPMTYAYDYNAKPWKKEVLPVLLPIEVIRIEPPKTREGLFENFEHTKSGELKLTNQKILDAQSGIFGEVVSRAMKSIFTGQGLVGMSLPIRIFEPRSTLQRIADGMCYVTTLLRKANDATDPLERAKYCLNCLISGMCMSAGQMKPFNPLLGETMEAEYSDGSQLYMEHTSHHPPISNFYVVGACGAKMYGRIEQAMDMGANSMEIIYRGPLTIEFSDGNKINMFFPIATQTGVVFGARMLSFTKKCCFIDEKNLIKGYLEMGANIKKGKYPGKRADNFSGEIYTYLPAKHKGYGENFKDVYSAFKGKDKNHELSKGEGNIFEWLEFDGVEYWSLDSNPVERPSPVANPLPSDFRFREDLIWLQYENKEMAQEWKYKLEEIQRYERSMRQEAEKKRKKGK